MVLNVKTKPYMKHEILSKILMHSFKLILKVSSLVVYLYLGVRMIKLFLGDNLVCQKYN